MMGSPCKDRNIKKYVNSSWRKKLTIFALISGNMPTALQKCINIIIFQIHTKSDNVKKLADEIYVITIASNRENMN